MKLIPNRIASAISVFGLLSVTAVAGLSPAEAADFPPTGTNVAVEHLNLERVLQNHNFGYTPEEMQKYFNYPQVFTFDFSGLDRNRLSPPPAPGLHPRVLISPADLPDLRERLDHVQPARLVMDAIRQMLIQDLTGSNARFGDLYREAVAGKGSDKLLSVEVACPIEYECFRCLVDQDAVGGRRAGAALAVLATEEGKRLDAAFAQEDADWNRKTAEQKARTAIQPPLRDFQRTMGITQSGLLALAYDFDYPYMSDSQRNTVRAVLAKASDNMTVLCAEGLPAFPANTSNWIPMHQRLLLYCCALEGEPGYDAGTYQRCVDSYKRFLNTAIFPAGDAFESMGKDYLLAEDLVPLAKRGINLVALTQLRHQMDSYYLHALDPWGGHFTFYDSLGGTGDQTPMCDVEVMKYLFPTDPALDFVYRNNVGEDYRYYQRPVRFGHPFYLLYPLVQAIFAQPYADKSWSQALADATAGKPLTFFSDGTGNLITASAWSPDAVQLQFLTRCVTGGHQYADRTHFNLYADGRYWAIYHSLRQVPAHYAPRNRSVILIDGQGPGMAPSRCAAFVDNHEATFIAADAKSSWDWTTGGDDRFPQGGQRIPFAANYFRLRKSDLPWMDMPMSDLPNWQTSLKGAELWLPNHPVERANRTAGLVRGRHPYVLIMDDIQKDDQPHIYNWGMTVADDVVLDSVQGDDVVLGERKPVNPPRHLLVRVLQADGTDAAQPPALLTYALPNPPQRDITMHRFQIVGHAVSPNFKVLLFPFRAGEELPQTRWNADHTRLTIEWSDQKDTLAFFRNADGRTRLKVERDGNELVNLK